MGDATDTRMEMALKSELASVERVEEEALRAARAAGFAEETASMVGLVAREAAVNAVVHGNRYDGAKRVRAGFLVTAEELRITIADEGEGLDVESIRDPLAAENLLRGSGRGIFLMRSFMDEVRFRNLSPGTQITLIKRRSNADLHPIE